MEKRFSPRNCTQFACRGSCLSSTFFQTAMVLENQRKFHASTPSRMASADALACIRSSCRQSKISYVGGSFNRQLPLWQVSPCSDTATATTALLAACLGSCYFVLHRLLGGSPFHV